MRASVILGAVLSTLAGIASAYTQPVGNPTGNPISKPGLHEKVPVGKPYTITWEPTLHPEGTVTLLLVKGPSNNVIPQYPIVEKTPNNGKYVWTPDASLPDSIEGYGIQLIVDLTGQYQWSTQFGFSNTGVVDHTTTTTTAITTTTTTAITTTAATATEETSTTDYHHSTTEVSHYPTTTTDYPVTTTMKTTTTTLPVSNTTIVTSCTTSTTTIAAKTTSHQAVNTTYVATTISTITVTPTNTPTHPKSSAPTTYTSGVSQNVVSFGMALLALAVAGFSMF